MPTNQINTQKSNNTTQITKNTTTRPDNTSTTKKDHTEPLINKMTLSPKTRKTLATEQINPTQKNHETKPTPSQKSNTNIEKTLSNTQLHQQITKLNKQPKKTNKTLKTYLSEKTKPTPTPTPKPLISHTKSQIISTKIET